jgi:hypothetical protein
MKSKETDNQRLAIKIKRLEKTNEIRETMINQIANNVKSGKSINPTDLMMSRDGENSSRISMSVKPSQRDLPTDPRHNRVSNSMKKNNRMLKPVVD